MWGLARDEKNNGHQIDLELTRKLLFNHLAEAAGQPASQPGNRYEEAKKT